MKKSEENAYSTKFKELTELKNFIGKEFGLTSWMQMSQKKIDDFAEITDDKQWIHTDPDKSALYSPYKKTVAHGFLVLSDYADFEYKCTDYYDPEDECGILWNDPDLAIKWPSEDPIISSKDAAASKLRDLKL